MENTTTQNNTSSLEGALKQEFLKRRQANPAYSMRAFANHLNIDQSLLAKILNGKRKLTATMAAKVAAKVSFKFAKSLALAGKKQSAENIYKNVLEDQIELLANWRHFAILELIKTKGFKIDFKWMAQRLASHPLEMQECFARLERAKFIQVKNKKVELLRPNNTWHDSVATSAARKSYQQEILTLSQKALETVDFELRDNSSLTIAISAKKLPAIKQRLKEMKEELAALAQPEEDEKNLDEVYQVAISLFPISVK